MYALQTCPSSNPVVNHTLFQVVNRVSQQVVEEERLASRDEIGPGGMLGLCHDHAEDVIYCYSDSIVFEASVC
jgi:hypothetical protein